MPEATDRTRRHAIPVIDLSQAPGERKAWDKPWYIVYLWAIFELIFVTNPFQISSKIRVSVLKVFGAQIGNSVIFRPRTRVKFPWKLHVGDRSWIGEGVWIHNQSSVWIGSDVVISQEAFITTGSHSIRNDMGLITKPVTIENGAWVTTRCIVLGGSKIGLSAVVTPNTVVGAGICIPAGVVFGNVEGKVIKNRFFSPNETLREDI